MPAMGRGDFRYEMERTCRAKLEREMPGMKSRFELLCIEADVQAGIVMQVKGQVAQYKIDEEDGREETSPQQRQRDPSKAEYEPQPVDLRGAGSERTERQQLLQRQQLPQSARRSKSSS